LKETARCSRRTLLEKTANRGLLLHHLLVFSLCFVWQLDFTREELRECVHGHLLAFSEIE
jgi:hypothetical protein